MNSQLGQGLAGLKMEIMDGVIGGSGRGIIGGQGRPNGKPNQQDGTKMGFHAPSVCALGGACQWPRLKHIGARALSASIRLLCMLLLVAVPVFWLTQHSSHEAGVFPISARSHS